MIDQEAFKKLCSYDWERIILDLTLYADNKLKFLKAAKVKLPLAQEPMDYAKEAVRLVFEGVRAWDSSENPDLQKFLKYSVVKSLIYNERTSPAVKKRVKNTVSIRAKDENEDEELTLSDTVKSNEPRIDLAMIEQQTLQSIRNALRDDDDAALVLEELIKSNKPREIASDLGIEIDEMRNIIKRIRRKAKGAIED